jgi:thiol:disulfide interchange protein DsbA
MKWIGWMAAAVLLMSGQAMAQTYREGVHYFKIDQAPVARDHVEVIEAFSYLCSHCATFEPYVQNWKKDLPENVKLKRIAVGFGRRAWELYSRGYITSSLMGIEEKAHLAMMDAVWKERKQMRSLDDLAEFYAQFGVAKDAFVATAQSFNVDTQLRRDQSLLRQYGINATPTMVVNGKYRISSSEAIRGFDEMLSVVDFLVAQELAQLHARLEAQPAEPVAE